MLLFVPLTPAMGLLQGVGLVNADFGYFESIT